MCSSDLNRPVGERLGRAGSAVVVVATVVVIVAPIVSFFLAGAQMEDAIEWGRFVRIGALSWLAISLTAVVGVTVWLWLDWESPDTDSMDSNEEIE